jgi:cytochrome c556
MEGKMKRIAFLSWIIMLVIIGCTNKQTEEIEMLKKENSALRDELAPPPSVLDTMYPPNTELPVYQLKMMEMEISMSGILVDLFENDMENVITNFENFKTQYGEVAKLVSEWKNKYPLEPVEGLGNALQSGEQEKVMEAFAELGKVCMDCHIETMAKVQQKYHWIDFREVKTTDPLTGEEANFPAFKKYLSTSFSGIGVNLKEGQIENALKQFEGFNARFQTLKDTCEDCHGTSERKYYVDESVQAMINNLGQALKEPSSLNPEQVQGLLMGVGIESCGKCHLVHVPAALAKMRWTK